MSISLHSSIFGLSKMYFVGCSGTNIRVVPSFVSENICYWKIWQVIYMFSPNESVEGERLGKEMDGR